MKNYRNVIWLKDIHHSPYLVLEGKLTGSADSFNISNLLNDHFRTVDCNHSGIAYALDNDNNVFFTVLDDDFALCFHIEIYHEHSISYITAMQEMNNFIDHYARKIIDLLNKIDETLEFNVTYMEDPIRYS